MIGKGCLGVNMLISPTKLFRNLGFKVCSSPPMRNLPQSIGLRNKSVTNASLLASIFGLAGQVVPVKHLGVPLVGWELCPGDCSLLLDQLNSYFVM